MTVQKTYLKTIKISLTRTVTITQTIPKEVVKRELLSPVIYGLFAASIISVTASALILAKRAKSRIP